MTPGGGDAARDGASPIPDDVLAAALEARLRGGVVQEVRTGERDLLVLAVRSPGRTDRLALSAWPGAPGAFMLPERVAPAPAGGPLESFLDLARSALVGARVLAVRALASGAGLRIELDRGGAAATLVLAGGRTPSLALYREAGARDLAAELPPDARPPEAGAPRPATGGGDAGPDPDLDAHGCARAAQRERALAHARRLDLRRAAARLARSARTLVDKREADVSRLGDAGELRARADALAAHLHLVRRGQRELVIESWHESGPLRVALDPAVPPAVSLDRAYAAAARAERGVEEARRRLDAARERLRALEAIVARLDEDDADAPGTFAAIERDVAPFLPAAPRVRAGRPAAAARAQLPAGVREHVSRDGLRILVGRDGAANDAVTFRLGSGNDAWFHARDAPGPHVVLKVPKGRDVPSESLLDAATLAHALSRRGDEPAGEVTWCRVRDVSRVPGGRPGQVRLTRERTLRVRVEPDRLARLRASR